MAVSFDTCHVSFKLDLYSFEMTLTVDLPSHLIEHSGREWHGVQLGHYL